MKYSFTARFIRSYRKFPFLIQQRFDKQLGYLLKNINHPSLHAKKYDETSGIWQGRVDKSLRFYFLIQDDVYILLDIQRHAK
jgi:mRNA-degrading endonuclease RelE of RelBE toxin-antitoxin system